MYYLKFFFEIFYKVFAALQIEQLILLYISNICVWVGKKCLLLVRR